MKILRILGLVVAIISLSIFVYRLFGNPNGKKYKADDKHTVYYKGDGVTEDDAKKVAAYYKEIGLFAGENEMDVQINGEKNSNEIVVKYIIDKSKITSETENGFVQITGDMAGRVFPGKTLRTVLADENLDDVKDLGVAPAFNQQQQTDYNSQQ